MKFLRNLLAAFVALIIFSGLCIFIVIGLLADEPPVTVNENSVLHIKLNKPISEIEFENPFESVGGISTTASTLGLVQLKEAINHAKNDTKIKGIYLDAPLVLAGTSTVQELRQVLSDFKKSGKFIIAYGEYYTESAYYLTSVANQVYLNPEGLLEFNGLGANVTFFKGLFEKLEIEPQIFRVGQFKSAVEPFIRKDLSAENELQISELLNSIYGNILDSISKSRNIEKVKLLQISSEMRAHDPKKAESLTIIDSLYYYDQVISEMKSQIGIAENEDLNLIKFSDYKKSFSTYKQSSNEVAVIIAAGDIVPGRGDMNTIGSESFVEEIREARKNDKIKAIVLRINSPGGSFVASDIMWREIQLTAAVKPVIASMSDVAASGGYYMAMACDTIVAQPTTITGSIGIFGMMFNAQGFLNNKLGITTDEVATGKYSNMMTLTRPLNDQEKSIIQNDLEQGYNTFIMKAAEGRDMTIAEIEAVASGRVWTGLQAKENGLVDVLGSLEDAVVLAANSADLDDYKVRYYPKQRSFLDQFFKEMEGESQSKVLKNELGEYYNYIEQIKRVNQMNGLQARWPYDLEIN